MQVSPELLLVLCMDQFIHTLVHDVSLKKITTGDENISLCQHRQFLQANRHIQGVGKHVTHVAEQYRPTKQKPISLEEVNCQYFTLAGLLALFAKELLDGLSR